MKTSNFVSKVLAILAIFASQAQGDMNLETLLESSAKDIKCSLIISDFGQNYSYLRSGDFERTLWKRLGAKGYRKTSDGKPDFSLKLTGRIKQENSSPRMVGRLNWSANARFTNSKGETVGELSETGVVDCSPATETEIFKDFKPSGIYVRSVVAFGEWLDSCPNGETTWGHAKSEVDEQLDDFVFYLPGANCTDPNPKR